VTSVPEITRMIARIEDWKEGRGKAKGRAETDRVLGEAHKLFDEISNMLTEMRRERVQRRLRRTLAHRARVRYVPHPIRLGGGTYLTVSQ
jgi:hypothetical protein